VNTIIIIIIIIVGSCIVLSRDLVVLHLRHVIGHFCPALQIAVKTMKIREKVLLTVI